jgi:hypothetical protein
MSSSCYICLEDKSNEELIKKGCSCKTIFVHHSCLYKYLITKKDIYNCEICDRSQKPIMYNVRDLNIDTTPFITQLLINEQRRYRIKPSITQQHKKNVNVEVQVQVEESKKTKNKNFSKKR